MSHRIRALKFFCLVAGFLFLPLGVKAQVADFNPFRITPLRPGFLKAPPGCRRVLVHYNKYDRAYQYVCPPRGSRYDVDLEFPFPLFDD